MDIDIDIKRCMNCRHLVGNTCTTCMINHAAWLHHSTGSLLLSLVVMQSRGAHRLQRLGASQHFCRGRRRAAAAHRPWPQDVLRRRRWERACSTVYPNTQQGASVAHGLAAAMTAATPHLRACSLSAMAASTSTDVGGGTGPMFPVHITLEI